MAITPVTIPDFYGGISQKSERLRALNEFQDVLNADVSLEEGIFKRNPISYVSAINVDVSANDAYVHTFIKSEDEHFHMVFNGSGVNIYNQDGIEQTLTYGSSDASSYFSGVDIVPRNVFNTVTIGDGVVVNRKDVTTRLDSALTDPADGSVAYLFVKQAQFGWVPLKWWFNLSGESYYGQITTAKDAGTIESVRNADGWFHKLGINTEALAIYIMLTINNDSGVNDGPANSGEDAYINWENTDVSATKSIGSVIKVFSTNGTDFENFNVADGLGDNALILMWKTAKSLNELPLNMPEDTGIIRIVGNKADLSDDFYVRFVTDAFSIEKTISPLGAGGSYIADESPDDYGGIDVTLDDVGAWKECAGFSLKYKYDYTTMPHVIVQRPDGSFLANIMDGDAFIIDEADDANNKFDDGANGWINLHTDHSYVVGDRIQMDYLVGTSSINEYKTYNPFPSEFLPAREYYVKEIDTQKIKLSETPTTAYITYTDMATYNGDYTPVKFTCKTYKKFKYGERQAGDDITNPIPSFIDNPINDMVLHRNRLAFISKDAVTLSEFGEFFNFFRITVQDVLDTAPIEVQTTDNTTRELRNAVSYKNQLLVFSKEGQFVLGGEPSLTPENVTFTLATAYQSDVRTRPFVLGDRLYFFEARRDRDLLHEIIERDFRGNYMARDATKNVPFLLSGRVQSVTNNGQDKIAIVTDNDLSEILVYNLKVDQQRGLIDAWHRYTCPDIEIEKILYIDNILHIVGLFQGKHRTIFTLDNDPVFTDAYLDYKFTDDLLGGGVYDAATDTTTYTTPITIDTEDWVCVDETTRQSFNLSGVTTTSFVVEGDRTSNNIVFGKNYLTRIDLSRFFPQSKMGKGPVVNDQLVIDDFGVSFDAVNYQTFDMSSVHTNGKSYVKTYTSNVLNTQNIGEISNPVDFATCLVQGRNRDVRLSISNETYLPFNLLNFEYSISEGQKRHTR